MHERRSEVDECVELVDWILYFGKPFGTTETLTFLVEEDARVFAGGGDVLGDVAEQFDDVRQMVLVPGIVVARVRLKQVVARRQLERLRQNGIVIDEPSSSLHRRKHTHTHN